MMQNHVDAADSNDVGSNSSSNNAKAVNQSRGHSSSTSSNSSLRPTIPAKPSNLRKDHGIGTSGGGGGGGGIGAKNKLKQHLQQQQQQQHDHQNDEVNHERNKIELSRKKEERQGRGDEENTRDEMCVYTHELVIVFAASTAMCCVLCMPRYDSLPFFVAHRGERERDSQ